MRISVSKDDPGFQPCDVTNRTKVLLDGRELKGCITADEERGECVVYARTADGQPVVAFDRLVTEFVKGKVEIVLPKDA